MARAAPFTMQATQKTGGRPCLPQHGGSVVHSQDKVSERKGILGQCAGPA